MDALKVIARGILLVAVLAALSCGCRPIEERPIEIDPALQGETTVKVVYPNVPGSFVSTAKKVKPSVVNIFTAQVVRDRPRPGLPGFEDLFRGPQRDRIQRSLGSGFIIDAQGFILTNYHVVRGAHEVLVQLEDGREVPAVPVGANSSIDVALLHVEGSDLHPVSMGNSDELEVGEWVVAIGNPFGLAHTVTAGIVSAKGRDNREIGMGKQGYQNFIQTDASINPGNSGGPLVNVAGEVVGMNTAISAAGQGIGFAVPINMVKMILPQLKRTGRVVPAWIGVGIRGLSTEAKERSGATFGVMITEVYDGGPAAVAGLNPGDIILRFNDTPVRDVTELAWMSNTAGVGNTVKLAILRDGRQIESSVKVSAKPFTR